MPAALLAAFLLGSIPFGYLVPRLARGIDIRTVGSGNPGFTNVFRAAGPAPGIAVLLADAGKGVLAVLLGRALGEANGAAAAGVAAIAGHVWTPFLRFRGGKGVATAAGVFFVLLPLEAGIALAVFLAAVFSTRYVSLGSVLGAAALPASVAAIDALRDGPIRVGALLVSLLVTALVVWRHRENVRRLLAGTENRFCFRKGNDR
ncbi:MAG: glycerol-3-phosphate 1-O-acyltransferase PlsY [Candidatus Eisenbacteria bacterium]|nr:glycerol-3-phosphate 1-O-acyltransferase PlsY [Candidatus Eisenbacteria bacterium]